MVVNRANEVEALNELCDVERDGWQKHVMEGITCIRDEEYYNPILDAMEPKWAANEYGTVVSRQNGKGGIIEDRCVSGLFLWGEKEIIYTSHHYRTMTDMFERIADMVQILIKNDPDARDMYRNTMTGNGAQGIYLKNGQKLLFMARSKASVRGMSPDTLILDEAMMKLGPQEVKAARLAVSARPNYQILNFGSAGEEEAVYFGAVRRSIMKVYDLGQKFADSNPRTGWSEWSVEFHTRYCDEDCTAHYAPDDPEAWRATNPSLGHGRLEIETIADECEKVGGMDMDAFLLDRCSDPKHWPSEGGGWKVIPRLAWESQRKPDMHMGDEFCLALDTAPDEEWTCITACGATTEDPELAMVEITSDAETGVLDYRPGLDWSFDRIVKIWKASGFEFVIIDPASPAGALIKRLEAQGIPVKEFTGRDYNHSCGEFLSGLAPKKGNPARIVHFGQAAMESAAGNADRKNRVELWSWDKTVESADITPITSGTKAYGGYLEYLYKGSVMPFFLD